jgi:hypothetical protein
MKAMKNHTQSIYSSSKRTFASHKKIDYNKKDLDIIFIGGIHAASTIKYLQYTGFHGDMAGFCARTRFYNEHLYEYLVHGNMKAFKYNGSTFASNFDNDASIYSSNRIVDIKPEVIK